MRRVVGATLSRHGTQPGGPSPGNALGAYVAQAAYTAGGAVALPEEEIDLRYSAADDGHAHGAGGGLVARSRSRSALQRALRDHVNLVLPLPTSAPRPGASRPPAAGPLGPRATSPATSPRWGGRTSGPGRLAGPAPRSPTAAPDSPARRFATTVRREAGYLRHTIASSLPRTLPGPSSGISLPYG